MTPPRPILVTGAAGLVGQAVCRTLQKDGHEVVAVVRHAREDMRVEVIEVDLAQENLAEAIAPRRPRVVVHCAAMVPTNPAYADTEENAAITMSIDRAAQEAAEAAGAAVVYLSSCGVYDPLDPRVKTEDSAVIARSPYFRAKLTGEQMFAAMAGSTLRLTGPVGRGMRPNLVLPRFVAAAARGEALSVWGTGAREQDFVAVDDVAEAVRQAVRRQAEGIFNVASGNPVSMRGLASTVVEAVGRGRVEDAGQPDPLEHDTARYSIAKARAELGWTPSVDLVATVREILEHGSIQG